MSAAIGQVREVAMAIAAAVEEQAAATREIAQNAQTTSAKTAELSKVIDEVRLASRQSGDSAEQVLQSVNELARLTKELRGECDSFLAQVRTA